MLNDRQLRNIKPCAKQYDLQDQHGLCARIHPSGSISFLIRFRFDGKQYRKKLGNYPGTSLKDARNMALIYKSKLDAGINPIEEIERLKREKEAEPTLSEFTTEFYDRYLQKNLKRPEKPLYLLNHNILPHLGDRKLSDIEQRDLISVLDIIVDRGSPVQANRTLSAVKKLFNYAVIRGLIRDRNNPALFLTKEAVGGQETPKKRFLSYPEIKAFWMMLPAAPFHEMTKCILRLLLLTGLRVQEVTGAEKSEINGRIWTIPAERTKTETEHKVPLTDMMMNEIELLMGYSGNSIYLCRSPLARYDGPIQYHVPARNLLRNPDYFGIPAFTPHDLRRTVATHMNELAEPWIVEKILNHKLTGVAAVYNLAEYLPERKTALEKWSRKIQAVVSEEKIIPIKKA